MSSTQDPHFVNSDDYDYYVELVTSGLLPSTGELYNSSQCISFGENVCEISTRVTKVQQNKKISIFLKVYRLQSMLFE